MMKTVGIYENGDLKTVRYRERSPKRGSTNTTLRGAFEHEGKRQRNKMSGTAFYFNRFQQ